MPTCITYSWITSEDLWGDCSESCGNGIETQTRQCFGSDGVEATAENCGADGDVTRACYLQPCSIFKFS